MVKFRYTDEMIDWLRAHSKGVPYDKLAVKFNRRFGLSKTARQIQAACHDHGAHNGIYKYGPTYRAANRRNYPVGSTRLTKDGYVCVKVAEPCHWDLAHLVEWEKYNGKLDRRKYIIMFRDLDRTNYHIDNLIKVNRRCIGVINEHMANMVMPETLESVILWAENKVAMGDAYFKLSGCKTRASAAANLLYHRRKSDPEFMAKRRKQAREYRRKYWAENRELCNQKQRDYRSRKKGTVR